MTPPLLLATTNAGKVREVQVLLGAEVPLLTLADLPSLPEPEESGRTFADNAALKAAAYATATGLPTIAEDSGLVIDALGGAPGVHSARYPGATYPDKFRRLFGALQRHPRPWTARYVSAVAVAVATGGKWRPVAASGGQWRRVAASGGQGPQVVYTTEGRCEGEIWPEPRGDHGFGYDPIFYYPAYGRTFGEIDDEEKLAVAHRGHAFRALKRWLEATRAAPLR